MIPEAYRPLFETPPFEEVEGPLREIGVVVVDSGIDGTHPDLSERIVGAWGVRPRGEGSAVVELAPRENNDRFGHGTNVAGMIVKHAPHVKLYDVGVLGELNSGRGREIVAGMEHALSLDVELINVSIAVTKKYRSEFQRLAMRARSRGITVLASRRNMPKPDDEGSPAELPGFIGVGLSADGAPIGFRAGELVQFEGRDGDIVAARGGGYCRAYGTSFATPFLTAACANLLGRVPRGVPTFLLAAALFARSGRVTEL